MKRLIRNVRTAIMTMAISSLVVLSCKKEKNPTINDNLPSVAMISSSPKVLDGIPGTLKVPDGNRLVSDAFAEGVQIYQVQRSAANPNIFLWVNVAPLATLYSKPDFTNEVVSHFAGPSWEFTKGPNRGQRVVARRSEGVTKDITAVDWLLLKAVDSLSSADNKITYIQRLFTVGGLPPAAILADEAHLGQMDSIPYTARYFFYEATH